MITNEHRGKNMGMNQQDTKTHNGNNRKTLITKKALPNKQIINKHFLF